MWREERNGCEERRFAYQPQEGSGQQVVESTTLPAEDDGPILSVLKHTTHQHTNTHAHTHTHTHTRQPPIGEGVAFFQRVKVGTEIKSRKGSLTMKYSISGKFATGLPAHVNELFKSRPRADYRVFDVTG